MKNEDEGGTERLEIDMIEDTKNPGPQPPQPQPDTWPTAPRPMTPDPKKPS